MTEKVGIYDINGVQMPCEPGDLVFARYHLPDTFGRAEREEAAARLVTLCQEEGRWVGVSFRRIVERIIEEAKRNQEISDLKDRNMKAIWKYGEDIRLWWLLTVVTFSIYAIWVKKPKLVLEEEPVYDGGESTGRIMMFGLEFLVGGFFELQDEGFIRIDSTHADRDGMYPDDVLYPTPLLAARMMECQHRATV